MQKPTQAVEGLQSAYGELDVRTAAALHNAAGEVPSSMAPLPLLRPGPGQALS